MIRDEIKSLYPFKVFADVMAMQQYINITFLRGDIVDCHPEETLSTEAEPRLTMLFEG